MKLFWACLGLTGVGTGLAMCVNKIRWRHQTLHLTEALRSSLPIRVPHETKTVTFTNFDQLPEPVAKYLRLVLREGQPLIRFARVAQTGMLRGFGQTQNGWMPFQATELFAGQRPGLIWDACIRASRVLPMQVRDSYVAGRAAAQFSALSLLTHADEHSSPELAQGEMQRYLAEAVWFPTALLPSAHLSWSPMDSNHARATLTEAGRIVSLEFQFNESGEVTSVYTPGRYRAVNGSYELTPWGGHHRAYREIAGMWIPTEGEVEWHLSSGAYSVWKGTIIDPVYEYVVSC